VTYSVAIHKGAAVSVAVRPRVCHATTALQATSRDVQIPIIPVRCSDTVDLAGHLAALPSC